MSKRMGKIMSKRMSKKSNRGKKRNFKKRKTSKRIKGGNLEEKKVMGPLGLKLVPAERGCLTKRLNLFSK